MSIQFGLHIKGVFENRMLGKIIGPEREES
jgi:hypothetical protein